MRTSLPPASCSTPVPDLRLRATERWFYRRGLPFFVEDYRSSTDVWTRATPALVICFLILMSEAVTSVDDVFGVLAGLGAAAVIAGAYAWLNIRRGRTWYSLPERVTWPVLAGFVVIPPLVTLASTRSWDDALGSVILGLIVLSVIWVLTRYAIIALSGWAIRYTFRGFSDLYRLTTRALPLLLLFITFLFLTPEVWQVAGSLETERLWAVLLVFIGLGLAVVIGRVPEEIRMIEAETTRAEVLAACADTPLADVAESLDGLDSPVALSHRQVANLGLVMTVAQLVQVILFAAVVWTFLVVLGGLAVSLELQTIWLDGVEPIDVVWTWGAGFGVTSELFRVALFLAVFSGFYVTIYTSIDSSYREHFYDRIRLDLERSLSVRRAYVVLRRQ